MRLSQKTATVAEDGEKTARVAEFGDSRTFLRQSRQIDAEIGDYSRQCGQALIPRDRGVFSPNVDRGVILSINHPPAAAATMYYSSTAAQKSNVYGNLQASCLVVL